MLIMLVVVVGIDHVQPLTAFALTSHQLLPLGFIHIFLSLFVMGLGSNGTLWFEWLLRFSELKVNLNSMESQWEPHFEYQVCDNLEFVLDL